MNPHACLLAVLISSGLSRSPGFPVQPPVQALRHAPPDVTPAAHDRPSPLTRMHARRGGKGRRRGRTGVSGSPRQANAASDAVRETSSTAAALAALAVQHASHEDLLRVAYSHRAALRPGLLSQALLRLAKVSELRIHRARVCCYETASLYTAVAAVQKFGWKFKFPSIRQQQQQLSDRRGTAFPARPIERRYFEPLPSPTAGPNNNLFRTLTASRPGLQADRKGSRPRGPTAAGPFPGSVLAGGRRRRRNGGGTSSSRWHQPIPLGTSGSRRRVGVRLAPVAPGGRRRCRR